MLHKREQKSVDEFDKWAPTYGKGFWGPYFRAGYKAVLEVSGMYLNDRSTTLDIGCGNGVLEFLLSEKVTSGKIVGLDLSSQMISEAQKEKELRGIDNVSFVVSKADDVAYPNESFDLIYCLNALHHFPHHNVFLTEINRLLKPNGKLILLDLILDNPIRYVWTNITKLIFEEGDVEFHTRKEIRHLVEEASLFIEQQRLFWYFTTISVIGKK